MGGGLSQSAMKANQFANAFPYRTYIAQSFQGQMI